MEKYTQEFVEKGYTHLPEFLHKDSCKALTLELKRLVNAKLTTNDIQCPTAQAIYGAEAFDKILDELLPTFESISGKKLYPTYSYARLYTTGDELVKHVDRNSCEISVTITLDFNGDAWSIFMNDTEIKMEIGDAVLYKGMEIKHWRNKYTTGKWQAQVFLHYVDANDINAEWKFDKRDNLSFVKSVKEEVIDYQYWLYDDILTEDACNKIIAAYSKDFIEMLPPIIGSGDGSVDLTVRNVERLILPTYKDIGGRLAAAGFSANQQAWKFNVTHANQAEFLKYPANGRYVTHVDTFMNPNEECRKLTVLAFLNDDFEGGKFYLQNSDKRFYPPQKKGTVIVFPSFIPHGVEDITNGTRYSTVCWLVGPFFK